MKKTIKAEPVKKVTLVRPNPESLKKCNRYEMEFLELLMFAEPLLRVGLNAIDDRLASIKNGRKRTRTLLTQMRTLLMDLATTVDDKSYNYLCTLKKHGELTIKVKPVSTIPGHFIVPEDCMRALVDSAVTDHCHLCIKEADEMKRCPLYKAMINVLPPDSLDESFGCPYRFVEVYRKSDLEGKIDG